MPDEQLKLLQLSLSTAVQASLGLPAADRRHFIANHLLAQHEGRQPPAGASPETFDDVRGILHGLGESLTAVVNEARGKGGARGGEEAEGGSGDATQSWGGPAG